MLPLTLCAPALPPLRLASLLGPALFVAPAGYGVAEGPVRRRGLLEDTRLGLELAVTAVFEAVRTTVRSVLFLPKEEAGTAYEVGGGVRGNIVIKGE